MNPAATPQEETDPVRHGGLQKPPENRKFLWLIEGLAVDGVSLQPMSGNFSLGLYLGSHYFILSMIPDAGSMNPYPDADVSISRSTGDSKHFLPEPKSCTADAARADRISPQG